MTRSKQGNFRRAAFLKFLVENAEFADNATTQYIFEQGFLAGQLREIDNSIAAFKRIQDAQS